jgi:hypothetical protein
VFRTSDALIEKVAPALQDYYNLFKEFKYYYEFIGSDETYTIVLHFEISAIFFHRETDTTIQPLDFKLLMSLDNRGKKDAIRTDKI